MADIGAADSAVPDDDTGRENKTPALVPQDDNSPSSSGLSESNEQPSSFVIQSTTSPSAFSSTDQTTKNGASSLLQPSKLGGSFRATTGISSTGTFGNNPFAQSTVSHIEPVSDSVIAPSKFTASPVSNRFSMRGEVDHPDDGTKQKEESKAKFQFRPSVLSSKVDTLPNKECVVSTCSNSSVSSILKPAKLPDPRQSHDQSGSDNEAQPKTVPTNEVISTSTSTDNHTSTSIISSTDESTKENHFTGLSEPRLQTSTVSNSGFVFGENLSNRVTGVSSTIDEGAASSLLFGEGVNERVKNGNSVEEEEDKVNEPDSNSTTSPDRGNRTLAESAREYQAKQDNKPDLKEVEVVTGEEDESNVLQATAKLYLFDSDNQTWIERGQGLCRLNDMTSAECGSFQSRLIMRTQGSLRLILNTPIWCGMTVERASIKSVRITATDGDDGVKVFLIMSNPKDSENMLRAIEWRIQRLKVAEDSKPKGDERVSEKRKADSTDYESAGKKSRQLDSSESTSATTSSTTSSTSLLREESDSSVQDPETEASCESHSSSLTIRSESE